MKKYKLLGGIYKSFRVGEIYNEDALDNDSDAAVAWLSIG